MEMLVRSPRLKLYAERIGRILDEERIRREAFYETVREDEKAEFINGEIIVQSPVKLEHNAVQGMLFALLRTYVSVRGLGFVGNEKLLIALTRNDYEPDVCYFHRAKADHFVAGQSRFPAPDFIAEVLSPSTEARDRGVKFDDYAAHGVGEYWIVDPDLQLVEQYVLEGDAFALRLKVGDGMLRSAAIPGFDIPARAIFDEAENLAALRRILGAGA